MPNPAKKAPSSPPLPNGQEIMALGPIPLVCALKLAFLDWLYMYPQAAELRGQGQVTSPAESGKLFVTNVIPQLNPLFSLVPRPTRDTTKPNRTEPVLNTNPLHSRHLS